MTWPFSKKARPPVQNAVSDSVPLSGLLSALFGGAMTQAGVSVSRETAERFSAVASCVRVLSDDVAALPLLLMRRNGRSKDDATDHPLYAALKLRPNHIATAFEFRQQMMRDKLLNGNAYALIIRNYRGQVVEMFRINPTVITVSQDPATLALSYRYSSPTGEVRTLSQRDVFHLRGPSFDGITGLSPIALYRETIGDGIAMRQHGSRFFGNGAFPGGVLELKEHMDAFSRKSLREDFEAIHQGTGNAHKVAILPKGITYRPVTVSMEDSQYLESRKFNRSEICGIFGVPPHKIGDLEKATFSNIEHQSLEYVTGSLMPHLVAWEQAISRDLLGKTEQDLYPRFNVSALLRGDAKSRAEALQIQRRNGVISANEWRSLEDIDPRPDPGGDGYIIEANMRPDDGKDPTAPKSPPEPIRRPL